MSITNNEITQNSKSEPKKISILCTFNIANSSQLSSSSQGTGGTDRLSKLPPPPPDYSTTAKLGKTPVRASSLAFGLMGNYLTTMIKYTLGRFTVPWIHDIAIFVGAKVAPDLVGICLFMRRLNTES